MIERFIVDNDGYLIDLETHVKYDHFDKCLDLLNSLNYEKIDNKRKLNTLKYRIGKLIE